MFTRFTNHSLAMSGLATLVVGLVSVLLVPAASSAQSVNIPAKDEFRVGNEKLSSGKVTGSGTQFGVTELTESMKVYDVFSVDADTADMEYHLEVFHMEFGRWELMRRAAYHGGAILVYQSRKAAAESGQISVKWNDDIIMYRVVAVPPSPLDWTLEGTFNTRKQAEEFASLLEDASGGDLMTKIESRNRLNLF